MLAVRASHSRDHAPRPGQSSRGVNFVKEGSETRRRKGGRVRIRGKDLERRRKRHGLQRRTRKRSSMSKRDDKIHAVEQAGRITGAVAGRLLLAMIAECAAIRTPRFDRGVGRASGMGSAMGGGVRGRKKRNPAHGRQRSDRQSKHSNENRSGNAHGHDQNMATDCNDRQVTES